MATDGDFILVPCEQGSPEWHQARAGAVTASMFRTARERLKGGPEKGQLKAAGRDYAFRLAVERISGDPLDEAFETWQMRRGHELEPEAREMHAFRRGLTIERAGFVLTPDQKFGASADGLIEPDGGSEYKCLVAASSLRPVLIERAIDDYRDQVQGCMWITGRQWWHLVFYCPALAAVERDLTVIPMERDDEYIDAMVEDLWQFERIVQGYEQQLREAA